MTRAPIMCIEGPSAVGKTSLAAALARDAGAAIVPELDATNAPAIAESAEWFVERHAAQWRQAIALSESAPLVVLDGDPFKGLWYNWTLAGEGWPGVSDLVPLYRAHVERGTLAFPDLYIVLGASEAQLRARRAADRTRTRRNFETHLRLVTPQHRYFSVLEELAPGRVLWMDTSAPHELPVMVRTAVARLASPVVDSAQLLAGVAAYVTSHDPPG